MNNKNVLVINDNYGMGNRVLITRNNITREYKSGEFSRMRILLLSMSFETKNYNLPVFKAYEFKV